MPKLPPFVTPKLNPIPPPGRRGGWGDKVVEWLLWLFERAYDILIDPILDVLGQFINTLFQRVEDELKPAILPLLDRMDAEDGMPPEFKRMTQHLRHSEPITFAAIAAAVIVSAIIGFAMGMIAPFQRLASQKADTIARSARLDPPSAFAAWKRGAISDDVFLKHCKEHGWPDVAIDAFSEIFAQRVGVGDLSTLLLRERMSEGAFDVELAKRGYKPDEIAKIKDLQKVIPALGDIIRMAVREAFTPEVVSRFQLHAELPGEMVAWAKKQGLSEDWARAYWASHWELPSLGMGFEMLHRGEITGDEMDLLIRTHDVSPFWRDKLTAIAYTPYTRVDVRRMYDAGVLDIKAVYRSYRDIGYDHVKATNMTAFTVALSNAAERDLTKSEVLNGFKIGYFREQEAREQIIALGYDEAEADYYISKVLYDLWQAEIKEQVKYLQQQYVKALIDQNQVYSELGRLNLPSEQINRYLRTWDIKRQAKTKSPTTAQLTKFRVQEIIGDGEFRSEMSGIGWSDRYIGWWLESIKKGD